MAYKEIHFPADAKKGTEYTEPLNNVLYIFDGVKWDVKSNNVDESTPTGYWDRDTPGEYLVPSSQDDYIMINGIKFDLIEEAP